MAISSANGALLYLYNLASPEVAVEVAYIGDISGFGTSSSKIDTSNHNDTSGYETHILGLKSPGEVSVKLFFDPTNATHNGAAATGLIGLANSQALRNWKIKDNRNATTYWTFAAEVMSMKFSKPVNGAQTADVTLAISGKLTHSTEP